MKVKCPNCKGKKTIVADYKECDACGGTGYEDTINLGNHFKGINNHARNKFDLDSAEDIPCEVCNGKGQVEVKEKCPSCGGTGFINVCKECGKILKTENKDYCDECMKDIKINKSKDSTEAQEEDNIVYTLDPLCEMEDLEVGKFYRGKITKVAKFGVFVSLNNQVWGLMRTGKSGYHVGQKINVKVTQIKSRKHEVDMGPVSFNKYTLKKLKKDIKRTKIEELNEDVMGKVVKIQGLAAQIQQTSGPTIFTITDETGTTYVAAFQEAGVRAYPEIEIEDMVEVVGEVNKHDGDIQIESESIEKLSGDAKDKLYELIDEALDEKASVEDNDFLIQSETLEKLKPKMMDAAKRIRRAILDGRTVLLRHHADADGICSGVAMEKAVVPLIEKVNPDADAKYHYFKRSPSKAPFYELEDVVKDLSFALEDLDRHGQKLPILVMLDNGSTEEDIVALMQTKIYDIEVVVIDHHSPGDVVDGRVPVDDYVDMHVNPYLVGGDSQITAGALATEVACLINPEVKDQIKHLPGIAAIGDHAESDEANQYIKLAEECGYSEEDQRKIAECTDFEAYFLRFMNGRGIIDTILDVDNHDKHKKMIDALYKEYEKRVDTQLKATLPNVKKVKLDNGIYFNMIDVEKYAHKFTFPAPGKTCGFVHDEIAQEIGEDKPIVTLGHGPDFGVIRATDAVNANYGFDINQIILNLIEKLPNAGIDGGGHECAGSIKFIEGFSKEVLMGFLEEVKIMNLN
ncbi:MAG: OB-fold nucleic acid binding domain-containing protein [Methanobrevibacter sp.]